MYVVDDKIEKYTENLKEIEDKISYLNHLLFNSEYIGNTETVKELSLLTKDSQEKEIKELYNRKDEYEGLIKDEERRREICREENVRRQHNYLPLIFEMLKEMSESGTLELNYKKAIEEEEENFKKLQQQEDNKKNK